MDVISSEPKGESRNLFLIDFSASVEMTYQLFYKAEHSPIFLNPPAGLPIFASKAAKVNGPKCVVGDFSHKLWWFSRPKNTADWALKIFPQSLGQLLGVIEVAVSFTIYDLLFAVLKREKAYGLSHFLT